MPASVTPQQLQSALKATMTETESFRHAGPRPSSNPQSTSFALPPSYPQQPHTDGAILRESSIYQTQSSAGYGQDPMMLTPGMVPNQPRLFVKTCSKCDWSSIPTYDGNAYHGAVSDYDSHMREAHPVPKPAAEAPVTSKDREEFIAATKPRKVEECEDDGVVNFCKARFFSSPLSWKNSQLSLPLEQSPVCTVHDYEPMGIEVNNRHLLKDLHKRDNKNLKLKFFTDANLTITPTMQDTVLGFEKGQNGRLFTSKAWKEIASAKDAIKAALNYMQLTRTIHPLDAGPQILYKVMFEKYLAGVATATNLANFFGSVTWELANRAARSELPYRYQELMNKWDTTYGSVSASAYLDNSALLEQKVAEKVAEAVKRMAPNISPGKNLTKRVRKPHSWCNTFNTLNGCQNTQREGGCTDQEGVQWKHGCNARVQNKPCNSIDHNRFNHVN